MRETGRAGYKASLIKELELRFPSCVLFNMDPNTTHQGIPDLLILYKTKWAMLEVKASFDAKRQPNQDYWVDFYHDMSYASFICPENEEEVLDDLQQAFASRRRTRTPQR